MPGRSRRHTSRIDAEDDGAVHRVVERPEGGSGNGGVLECLHRSELGGTKPERNVLLRERYQWFGDLGEVADEDPEETEGAEEGANVGYGGADRPVDNRLELVLNDLPTLVCAAVTDYHNLGNTNFELLTAERSAGMSHAMEDAMKVVEMFPNEAADAGVARMKLVLAVR